MRYEKDKSVTDIINAIKYKEAEPREDQTDGHKYVDTINDNTLDTDWQGNVNIGAQHAENRPNIPNMTAEFQDMCHGRWFCITRASTAFH